MSTTKREQNADGFTDKDKAALELQKLITKNVTKVSHGFGLDVDAAKVATAINRHINPSEFNVHNDNNEVVEVRANFEGWTEQVEKSQHGSSVATVRKFDLEVTWNADKPNPKLKQTAHYGWELNFNPQNQNNSKKESETGHVYFTNNFKLSHTRPDLLLEESVDGLGPADKVVRFEKTHPQDAVVNGQKTKTKSGVNCAIRYYKHNPASETEALRLEREAREERENARRKRQEKIDDATKKKQEEREKKDEEKRKGRSQRGR